MSLSKRLNSLRERLTLRIPSWLINLRVMVKGFQPAMSNSNKKTSRKNLRRFHHLKPQLSRCLKRRTLLRRRMSLDQNRLTLWPFRKLIRTTVVTYFSPLSKFLSLWGSRSNSTLWSRKSTGIFRSCLMLLTLATQQTLTTSRKSDRISWSCSQMFIFPRTKVSPKSLLTSRSSYKAWSRRSNLKTISS